MNAIPEGFAQELEKIWNALVADLGLKPVRMQLQPGTLRGFLEGDVFAVPEGPAKHFQRFGTIPTSLVRDAAYEAKKRQLRTSGTTGSSLEADAMAYAELFLRAAMMQGHDPG